MTSEREAGGPRRRHAASQTPSLLMAVTARDSLLFARLIARGLAEEGWAIKILVGGEGVDPPGDPVCPELRISSLRRRPSPFDDLVALRRTVGALRRLRPALVLSATPKAGLITSIGARLTRTPHVHYVWGLRSEGLTGPARRVQELMEAATVRLADSVLAVSPSLASSVSRLPLVARPPTVLRHGSSHGVDLDMFTPAPQRGSQRGQSSIGFLGRFHPDKGIADLEPLIHRLRASGLRFELALYGSPDQTAPEVVPVLRRLEACDEVVFYDTRSTVAEFLQDRDVLVHPSRREGLPNSVLEAAATGLPTVGYDVTGTRDAVVDGVTGRLVPLGDTEALASACADYLAESGLRRSHGRAARRFVEERFAQQDVLGDLNRHLRAHLERAVTETTIRYVTLDRLHRGSAAEHHVEGIVAGMRAHGIAVGVVAPPATASPVLRIARTIIESMRQRRSITYLRMHHLGFVTLLVGRLRGSLCVVEVNGGPTDYLANRPQLRIVAPLLRAAWATTEQLAHLGIAAGDAFAPHVPRLLRRNRLHVIPNGADLRVFRPDGDQTPAIAAPYAVFFGTLTHWQGIGDLLRAVGEPAWPTDLGLVFIGDGPEADSVRGHPEFGRRVVLLPRVPSRQLASYLRAAEVSLSPQGSARASANPLKVAESVACGVPVVVTDHPGQSELVAQNHLGIVVPCDDPGALALAVGEARLLKPGFASRTAHLRRTLSWTSVSHLALEAMGILDPSARSACDPCQVQEQ